MINIIGYENRYKITCEGKVWSVKSNKFLKPKVDKDGYLRVGLYDDNGKQRFYFIHRLVATAFCLKKDNHTQVNHKDGNKQNNNVNNLEWCSVSENVKHSFDTGLKSISEKHKKILSQKAKKQFKNRIDTKGSQNGNAKLTEKDIPIIKQRIANNENMSAIARDYNISPNAIYEIKIGKKWGHIK